ncbi:MAG: [acyl-carrier-protein] S-malonyltransferase [Acidobacteriota bacterium]|jgi:[acyl-carrier-protein] S-malonyltransferase|nr:[acyl-carrier-protein] S-malonyltransferase [Acidobacteriota bacterium]
MSLAFIFPGQGSQSPGMGRELAAEYAAAREVFEEADDALGFALSRLCFEGPAEELQLTENTQPAILAASIAALRAAESEGLPRPDFVAGHSLGEYSALVAAGALSLRDAVQIVRKRGSYMQEAVPVGVGAMAAVLGSDIETVESVCAEALREGEVCSPANINSPGQIVIAGSAAAVERAGALLKERGAKRVIPLKVSAPFHCALMLPAQERLAADLERVEFKDLSVPLVTNVDAALIRSGAQARDSLIRQVSSPVRWRESVELLVDAGVELFVELGPGKVLSGLVRQTAKRARSLNIEDAASLASTRTALGEEGHGSGHAAASV